MSKKAEFVLGASESLFNQITGVWDTILNSERIKDKENDIVMQIQNFTDRFIKIEMLGVKHKEIGHEDASNNAVVTQPFVDSKAIDIRTNIRTPGEGTLIWDNAKVHVRFFFGHSVSMDIFKKEGVQTFTVRFTDSDGPKDHIYGARQAFTAFYENQGSDLRIGLSYADDTNTFVLMVLQGEGDFV